MLSSWLLSMRILRFRISPNTCGRFQSVCSVLPKAAVFSLGGFLSFFHNSQLHRARHWTTAGTLIVCNRTACMGHRVAQTQLRLRTHPHLPSLTFSLRTQEPTETTAGRTEVEERREESAGCPIRLTNTARNSFSSRETFSIRSTHRSEAETDRNRATWMKLKSRTTSRLSTPIPPFPAASLICGTRTWCQRRSSSALSLETSSGPMARALASGSTRTRHCSGDGRRCSLMLRQKPTLMVWLAED
mmetsp:Transcript_11565/g.27736  ORF Transcript_11565/g.27736 Transcript_11565/m.27736 type:complete len:245 (+) Transcript_11565:528-1262(+)